MSSSLRHSWGEGATAGSLSHRERLAAEILGGLCPPLLAARGHTRLPTASSSSILRTSTGGDCPATLGSAGRSSQGEDVPASRLRLSFRPMPAAPCPRCAQGQREEPGSVSSSRSLVCSLVAVRSAAFPAPVARQLLAGQLLQPLLVRWMPLNLPRFVKVFPVLGPQN